MGLAAALCASVLVLMLAGCGTTRSTTSGSAGWNGRDGASPNPPADLERVPDAEPRFEAIRPGGANKPYLVDGKRYEPVLADLPMKERGLASWYGRKFHGRPTANGETYDMYAMTAAHPTMPLPSYARVRNPANGREAIVRINDRGPFYASRVIDLSYTAALKLGLLRGVGIVEVERITNEDIRSAAWRRPGDGAGVTAVAAAPIAAAPVAAAPIAAAPNASSSASASASAEAAMVAVPVKGESAAAARIAGADPSAAPAAGPDARAAAPAGRTREDEALPASSGAAPVPSAAPTSSTAVAPSITPAPVPALVPTPVAATALAAAPAAATSAEAAATASTSTLHGYWVQLGAFRQRDGALSFQRRVTAELDWLAPLLSVIDDAPMHRLQAGPYTSREAANVAAERVHEALKLVPVIIERH